MFDFSNDRSGIAVVLVDGFSVLSFGSIVEPLRYIADEFPALTPKIDLISLDGPQAISKSGVAIDCDRGVDELISKLQIGLAPQAILICSGTNDLPSNRHRLVELLRRANRNGVPVGGIGCIAWLMAEIGLLTDKKSTIHWKRLSAFMEKNVDVKVQNALFVSDGIVSCCAGELATLDLIVELIAAVSPAASEAVANHFLISAPRHGDTLQPGSQMSRLRNVPETLVDAVKLMVDHLEEPLFIQDIAKICEVSSRKLERHFRDHLGISPLRFYRSLKLERAFELVSQTNLTIQEVALASGFGSTTALHKHFKQEFSLSPAALRNQRFAGVCAKRRPKQFEPSSGGKQ